MLLIKTHCSQAMCFWFFFEKLWVYNNYHKIKDERTLYMNYLAKEKFYFGIIAGAKEVMQNRAYLNEINVYPVPDGDTGSNLYAMMQNIINHTPINHNIDMTLETISESAIIGAKGNSGLLFAQYIDAFIEEILRNEMISSKAFLKACQMGMNAAYNAIEKPIEGTILTIMRVFYEALKPYETHDAFFDEPLEMAKHAIDKAVDDTTDQLMALKKASVVDSGAKGFLYFITGFIRGITLSSVDTEVIQLKIPEAIESHHFTNETLAFRYCFEVLLKKNEDSPESIGKYFEGDGDSVIVTQTKHYFRMHLHTNFPCRVFQKAMAFGYVEKQKVDDMLMQYTQAHHRKFKTAIVTDSVSDIPDQWLLEKEVSIIPLSILSDEGMFLDKRTLDNDFLFKHIEQTGKLPTSSQPDRNIILNQLEQVLSHYDQVMVLTVSSALSGTYNSIKKVADDLLERTRKHVDVIDTKQNSAAQGLLVWYLAKLRDDKEPYDVMVEKIQDAITRTKIIVRIAQIDHMIWSGRLNIYAGRIAKLLRIKPLITLDAAGQGTIQKLCFNRRGAERAFLDHIQKTHKEKTILYYALTYVDDPKIAEAVALDIKQLIGFDPVYIVESSSVIALGAGKGAVAIGYMTKET